MLPFTPAQFLAVFAEYNVAIWPGQIVAYVLGGIAVLLVFRPTEGSSRAIALVLSAMWIWTGVLYHGVWFSQINRAAYLFATLFAVEGVGFLIAATSGNRLRFGFRRDTASWAGAAFVGYAAVVYPLI